MKQDQYETMMEEINSVTNPVHKDILMQKYGLIEPKLAEFEKMVIQAESEGVTPFYLAVA